MSIQAQKLASIITQYVTQLGGPALLSEVAAELTRRSSHAPDTTTLTVTSAGTLGTDDKKLLERYGKTKLGARRLVYQVDPALLAGLRLRIGDTVIDHSLTSQLNKLKESLTK